MNNELLKRLQESEILILNEVDRICKKHNINYVLVGGTLLGAVRHNGFIPWDDDLDIAMLRKDYKRFLKICESELNEKFFLDCYKKNKNYWLPFAKVRLKDTIYQEITQKKYSGHNEIWLDIFPLDNAKSGYSKFQKFQFTATAIFRFAISKKSKILSNFVFMKNKYKRIILWLIHCLPKKILICLQNFIMTFNKNDNSKYLINLGSQYGYKKQTHLREKYFPVKELEFNGKKYPVPNDYDYVLTKIYGPNYMELPPLEKRITHNPIRIKLLGEDEIKYEKEI